MKPICNYQTPRHRIRCFIGRGTTTIPRSIGDLIGAPPIHSPFIMISKVKNSRGSTCPGEAVAQKPEDKTKKTRRRRRWIKSSSKFICCPRCWQGHCFLSIDFHLIFPEGKSHRNTHDDDDDRRTQGGTHYCLWTATQMATQRQRLTHLLLFLPREVLFSPVATNPSCESSLQILFSPSFFAPQWIGILVRSHHKNLNESAYLLRIIERRPLAEEDSLKKEEVEGVKNE